MELICERLTIFTSGFNSKELFQGFDTRSIPESEILQEIYSMELVLCTFDRIPWESIKE
jgi:hypothetical protein